MDMIDNIIIDILRELLLVGKCHIYVMYWAKLFIFILMSPAIGEEIKLGQVNVLTSFNMAKIHETVQAICHIMLLSLRLN